MKSIFSLCFILLSFCVFAQNNFIDNFELKKENAKLFIKALNTQNQLDTTINGDYKIKINGSETIKTFQNGKFELGLSGRPNILQFTIAQEKSIQAKMYFLNWSGDNFNIRSFPMWLSIVPPLLAILLALIFKEVLLALFAGIWSGAFILSGMSFKGFFSAILTSIDTYVLGAMNDSDHISVIIFSMLIGGMVAIISRNGGMLGIVNILVRYARSARSSQFVTWLLGISIFFDDYANSLIVGNTMRPITDKYKISREKLAYIVDSTAAPVSAIAFVTTWVGAELGYIKDAVSNISGYDEGAYSIFFNSLAYSYYPILTLFFILILVFTGRDFGAMFRAEKRARTTGEVSKPKKSNAKHQDHKAEMEEFDPVNPNKARAINGVLPVLTVVFGTLIGLLYTGYNPVTWSDETTSFITKISKTIGDANSYAALIWASLSAVILALLLTISQKIMRLDETLETLLLGFKTMMQAMLILILAWALANITKDGLFTGEYLTTLFSGNISARYLPEITFLLAGVIAFSTGSSWGTMAILYPLIIPTTWLVCQSQGLEMSETMPIFYSVIACVLAGAVFGDHCSPISDTTILSSLASNCNHIDHVNTQLPYAVVVALVANLICTNLASLGLHFIFVFLIGILVLYLFVRYFGKKVSF